MHGGIKKDVLMCNVKQSTLTLTATPHCNDQKFPSVMKIIHLYYIHFPIIVFFNQSQLHHFKNSLYTSSFTGSHKSCGHHRGKKNLPQNKHHELIKQLLI